MAILICYLHDDEAPRRERVRALYLRQPFYESAHALVDEGSAGPILERVLTMGYGGTVLVEPGQTTDLLSELEELEASLRELAQLGDLRSVLEEARDADRALVFSGDMYPELDKELRKSIPVAPCPGCGEVGKSPFREICDCGHVSRSDSSDS